MSKRTINALASHALLALLLAVQSGCQPSVNPAKSMETIHLGLKTPAAGWTVEAVEAWETDETIFCVFQLMPPKGMAAQVISKVEAEMRIPASTKLKRLVVLGKTWNWGSDTDIDFPIDQESFRSSISTKAIRIEIQSPNASER